MYKIKDNGFTLAEVLLTLLIVGVISSIVIPALIADTQQAELKTAWKKAYSNLEQVTRRLLADNGGSLKGVFVNDNSVKNTYLSYLSYSKSCNYPNNIGNCWHKMDGSSKDLKGNNIVGGWGSGSGIILNNGNFIRFRFNQSDCRNIDYGIPICGHMTIDVNGFKGPNVTGKDIFAIYIQENAVKPFGGAGNNDIYKDDCKNLSQTHAGLGCSVQYLMQ